LSVAFLFGFVSFRGGVGEGERFSMLPWLTPLVQEADTVRDTIEFYQDSRGGFEPAGFPPPTRKIKNPLSGKNHRT
jgi:hypothetical protein